MLVRCEHDRTPHWLAQPGLGIPAQVHGCSAIFLFHLGKLSTDFGGYLVVYAPLLPPLL